MDVQHRFVSDDFKMFFNKHLLSNETSFNRIGERLINSILLKPLDNKGYLRYNLWKDGKKYRKSAHRLVWENFMYETELEIDHINGIKTDNRLENLKPLTTRENTSKRSRFNKSNSLPTGVTQKQYKSQKKYVANIYYKGKQVYLGTYDTIEYAKYMYDKFIYDNVM